MEMFVEKITMEMAEKNPFMLNHLRMDENHTTEQTQNEMIPTLLSEELNKHINPNIFSM